MYVENVNFLGCGNDKRIVIQSEAVGKCLFQRFFFSNFVSRLPKLYFFGKP
jgi:hypothetical protein